MKCPNTKQPSGRFPPDLLLLLSFCLAPLAIGMLANMLVGQLLYNRGPMLAMALVLALSGLVMLFNARLPLYRQRRYFTFGPALLDEAHQKLYRWAYGIIGAAAFLLSLLAFT